MSRAVDMINIYRLAPQTIFIIRAYYFNKTAFVINIIIITITAEDCTNIRAKFFVILYENCSTNCYCNFNPCGIFESMTSFTPFFNQHWNKEN